MKTRLEAAKELWRCLKGSTLAWWKAKAAGDYRDQTLAWAAACGLPGAALGLWLCPRTTVFACAAAWAWFEIEKRRK